MSEAGLFSLSEAKFIADDRRDQYRGQLARVALSIFDVGGSQYGIAMTYHDSYRPDLDQYEAWSRFWHDRCLRARQRIVKPNAHDSLGNALYSPKDVCYIDGAAPHGRITIFGYTCGTPAGLSIRFRAAHPERRR